MKRFLKIAGIIVLLIIVAVAGFIGYAYYKMKHVKDTHDLQASADKMCRKFIQEQYAPGICIGIVKGDIMYVKGYGVADKDLKTLPDGNTIFEIGSISKVFTSVITQRLVDAGQLQWSDNILKYMPDSARLPVDDGTTLMHLSSHTSGFPRLPDSLVNIMTNECDPYSTLTDAQFAHYLKHCTDKKKPDLKSYDYSNLGAGLLARITEYRTNESYEALLQELICAPLHMNHTSLHVADSTKFATGYDEKGNKTCHWNFPILYGCGAIRSNVYDMLKFLRANMNEGGPLYASLQKTHAQVAEIPMGGIAHGWHIDKANGVFSGVIKILWHNGGTGGFHSYMGFDPKTKTGVIVLANRSTDEVDRLGIDLIVKAATTSFKEE